MYTKAQKRFWVVLIIFCLLFTYVWYEIFSMSEIEINRILGAIFILTIVSGGMHWWGIAIAKTGNFWSRSFGDRKKPASCESWKTVQKGVPGVNFILFLVPVTVAWILKSLL